MSIIRDMLYNGMSLSESFNNTAYNQNLLQNFIRQHQPRFILHCGSPDNAIRLGLFIKQHHQAEILFVRNWNPATNDWLHSNGAIPNPHQNFLDKIEQYGLEDILISFDGYSTTAAEVLAYRSVSFDMMISDNISNNTDYLPLQKLLKKNAIHIRYIGDKKLTEIKNEKLFEIDNEASFCFAQGYLIIGVDYLSLYEEAVHHTINPHDNFSGHTPEHQHQQQQHQEQHLHHDVQKYYNLENFNDYTNNHINIVSQAQSSTQTETSQDTATEQFSKKISEREQRILDRQQRVLARQKRREERQARRDNRFEDDDNEIDNNITDEHKDDDSDITQANFVSQSDTHNLNDVFQESNLEENLEPEENSQNQHNNKDNELKQKLLYDIDDDGSSTISAARKALRARHAARRLQRRQGREGSSSD